MATSSTLTVTIRNAGTATIKDTFWVDVYFNPRQTPVAGRTWDTIADYGAAWGVTRSLGPGQSLVLTNAPSAPYYFPGYSSPPPLPVEPSINALADSVGAPYGAVSEEDEGNDLYGPVTSTSGVD